MKETKRAYEDLCLSSQVTRCVLSLRWRNTSRCCRPIHRPFISIQSGQTAPAIYGKLIMYVLLACMFLFVAYYAHLSVVMLSTANSIIFVTVWLG